MEPLIVALIGVFLLFYGLWYPLEGNLWDYLAVTGTIYLASIDVLLIACCYWPGANSWGAAASIVVSAAIPIAYLVLSKYRCHRQVGDENDWPELLRHRRVRAVGAWRWSWIAAAAGISPDR